MNREFTLAVSRSGTWSRLEKTLKQLVVRICKYNNYVKLSVTGAWEFRRLASHLLIERVEGHIVDPLLASLAGGEKQKDTAMRKPDDAPRMLAKVIDFEQARARRRLAQHVAQANAKQAEPGPGPKVDPECPPLEADLRQQWERTVQKRRHLQERTAKKRAAASRQRIQLRVGDRLARIEAELEAEIARLRLAYAERRRAAGGGIWMWPTMAASLLALVAGLAYFAGTQQTFAASATAVPQRVATKHTKNRSTRRSDNQRAPRRVAMSPAQRSPSGSCSGGSTSGTPYKPALPASGAGCGGTPYRSMSPASGSTGGTP